MKLVNNLVLGVITAVFLAAGLLKVFNTPEMTVNMSELHMGGKTMFVIGFTEVLGAVGLWLRRTRLWALLGLYSYAVGALAMHLAFQHDFFAKALESFLMVVLIPVALLLDERFRYALLGPLQPVQTEGKVPLP